MPNIPNTAEILLRAKMKLPPIQNDRLFRARVNRRIAEGLQRNLTIITAPAGYGKTTAATMCLYHEHISAGWLTLDMLDNDPARFWRYTCAVLDVSLEQQKILLYARRYTLIDELIQHIDVQQKQIVLVYDDMQFIRNHRLHNEFLYFAEHAPPSLHILCIARNAIPIGLSKLKLREEIAEITEQDLQFTAEESAALLRQIYHITITDKDARKLVEQTRGWGAALHLAGQAYQKDSPEQFQLERFTGQNRLLVEYLEQEALKGLNPQLQIFIKQISVLPIFNAESCMAVTQNTAGYELFHELIMSKIFIEPVDIASEIYRFHPLIGDFLHAQLRAESPELLSMLARRAAEWFSKQNDADTAIFITTTYQLWDIAIPLIIQTAPSKMLIGEIMTIYSWLQRIPKNLRFMNVQLIMIYAAVLSNIGQLNKAEKYTNLAAHILIKHPAEAQNSLTPVEAANSIHGNIGEVWLLKTMIASSKGQIQLTQQYLQQALYYLPPNNELEHALLLIGAAAAYWWDGNMNMALIAFQESYAFAIKQRIANVAITSLYGEGFTLMAMARLQEALIVFRDAICIASTPNGNILPVAGMVYIGYGAIYREWDITDEAVDNLQKGLKLAPMWGDLGNIIYGQLQLLRVETKLQHNFQSLKRLRSLERLVIHSGVRQFDDTIASAYAFYHLYGGNAALAKKWALAFISRQNEPLTYLSEQNWLIALRILITTQTYDKVETIVQDLEISAKAAGRFASVLEILIWKAVLLKHQMQETEALQALEAALQIAEPSAYMRIFCEIGPIIIDLLSVAQTKKIGPPKYLANIISHIMAEVPYSKNPTKLLSSREQEILVYIAEGLENKEIAAQLHIAPNTVKWYVKNIFLKLHTHTRAQAVAYAREQRLI